ncbi:MAG: 2,5-dihydroxypyridine 5,6-dioxygenase [Nitrosomonadaceae bacterium]|nr:2,5-dihydroxypyridine 5,6-dioxygenase [Nitrosomonadaceae bacterium]
MYSIPFWDEFAEETIKKLVRPKPGDPLLILTDTSKDLNLAQAFLAAGIRAGADAQLMIKSRAKNAYDAAHPGPILAAAIKSSKLILSIVDDGIDTSEPILDARQNGGTRVLFSDVTGVERYVVRALLDVDVEAMLRNGEKIVKLWDETDQCRVISPQGTDVSFQLKPRKCTLGDGALTKDGESDFFPGAQVNIAPVEETINGVIVIDASDSVQGLVHAPYKFIMEKGVITAVEGGKEADVMRNWLANCNDDTIYNLCHFSIGLNPQAGISGKMIEDERMLGAIDFGFGYQNPSLGGTVGLSDYHMDIMLATPTVYLDGKEMSGGGQLNPKFGFEVL